MYGDFTTVADVELYSGIKQATATDALLQKLITSASAFMTKYLNRNLFRADYNEVYNGSGNAQISLRNLDTISVSAVTIDGFAVPAAVGPRDVGYVLSYDPDGRGVLYYRWGIFCKGIQNVQVTSVAGLVTYDGSPPAPSGIPQDLAQVCIDLVTVKYNRRTNLQIQGETLAQQTITYNNGDLTPGAARALSNWIDYRPL